MSSSKKAFSKRVIFLVAILNAFVMLAATLYYLSKTSLLDDELMLIKYTSVLKMGLSPLDKPDKDRFAFVNVGWDRQLIPKYDSSSFEIGNIDITNRTNLGKFVKAINANNNHKYLIIDVIFEDKSPYDSLLQAELLKVKNCRVSYHKGKDNLPVYPVLKAPLGLSDMQTDRGDLDLFIKYHLMQGKEDSIKSTPLLMYEDIYGKKIENGIFYHWINGKPIFNGFILNFRLWWYDFLDHHQSNENLEGSQSFKKVNYYHMSELANLPQFILNELAQEYFKDRIVIVGDFENRDIHNTLYSTMPGSLILLNAFLALEAGDNIVSVYFLLFLFIAFTIVSYKAIDPQDILTLYLEKKFKDHTFVVEMSADAMVYLVYFAIVSIISFFVFSIHLTILFLSFYMFGLEQGIIFIADKIEEKNR